MQVNSIDTSNTVSVAPFVDNYTAEDSAPDSNQEAVQNEAKTESNDSESNNAESNNTESNSLNINNYNKILGLEQNQQKILSLLNILINKQQSKDDSNVSDENASETESEDTEISNKEGYNMHTKVFKHATEDDVLDEPLTADEVLDTVVDEGIGFEEVTDDAKDTPAEPEPSKSAVNNGDNEAGSTEEPEDYPELQPVTTATAMRLADKYIKAGVIKEAHRFDAIERMSKMSKIAARNQMIAIDMLTKANKVKAAKLAKLAAKTSMTKKSFQEIAPEPKTWIGDSIVVNFVDNLVTAEYGYEDVPTYAAYVTPVDHALSDEENANADFTAVAPVLYTMEDDTFTIVRYGDNYEGNEDEFAEAVKAIYDLSVTVDIKDVQAEPAEESGTEANASRKSSRKIVKKRAKKHASTETEELDDDKVRITITDEDGTTIDFVGPKDKGEEFLANHKQAKKVADLYEDENPDEDEEEEDDDTEPAPSVEEIKREIAKREFAGSKLYAAKKSMFANKPSTSQFVRASKLSRMAKLNSDKKLARTPRVAGITESTDAAMSLL